MFKSPNQVPISISRCLNQHPESSDLKSKSSPQTPSSKVPSSRPDSSTEFLALVYEASLETQAIVQSPDSWVVRLKCLKFQESPTLASGSRSVSLLL